MKRVAFIASALAVGAVLGWGATQYVIATAGGLGGIDNNGWRTSAHFGAVDAGPYTRAIVARAGLLALNQEETIYYTRTRDEGRRAFDAGCTYRIDGARLPARWWSITLYAEDHFLAVNGAERHSVDATSIDSAEDGAWTVRVGPLADESVNWISTTNAGAFSLSIRLYNPENAVRENMGGVALPTVTRESCGAGP